MPRITLVTLATLLLLSTPVLAKGGVAACGKRVQAFNEYEELDKDKKIVEKVSLFDVGEWSPDSGFQGLAIKADEDANTKVQIEVSRGKKAKSKKKTDLSAKAWKDRQDYRQVEDFNGGKAIFGENYEAGTFVVRLTLNGKVLCQNSPLKIAPSGD
ncbi:MAG: hypothetical protein ACXWQO_16060 [Bdellovibrionota bacterium]